MLQIFPEIIFSEQGQIERESLPFSHLMLLGAHEAAPLPWPLASPVPWVQGGAWSLGHGGHWLWMWLAKKLPAES